MRDFCARLTPLGWVALIIVSIVVLDKALPILFSFVLWTAIIWGASYLIAFIYHMMGWE